MGVETCYWPLFEVDHGKWILNYEPKKKLPIEDFLRPQGRFKHLFKKGNEDLLEILNAVIKENQDAGNFDKWVKEYSQIAADNAGE